MLRRLLYSLCCSLEVVRLEPFAYVDQRDSERAASYRDMLKRAATPELDPPVIPSRQQLRLKQASQFIPDFLKEQS